jgi:hypothetical protein
MNSIIKSRIKNWILPFVLIIVMNIPTFFFVRYACIFHHYVKWEHELRVTHQHDKWIPSTQYVNLKRIFFLDNTKLPKLDVKSTDK